MPRSRIVAALLALIVAGGAVVVLTRGEEESDPSPPAGLPTEPCSVDPVLLQRVRNGYMRGRSGDVLTIERRPHQFGTRHSTPYAYTQDVPLVLYGPGYIRPGVTSQRAVTLASVAPTLAELLGFDDFPRRAGRPLREALLSPEDRNGLPRLVVVVVWDGGGDNVLREWPNGWPELARLMESGASYGRATVGSSPSITPSIHATLGTGAFPATHGLTDIKVRVGDKILDAWPGTSPRLLRVETFAEMWDKANDNEPLVGLLARDSWHLGMIGHGSYAEGGDKDIAVLDDLEALEFTTNPDFYSMPDYVTDMASLPAAVEEVDLRDGTSDDLWLENPLAPLNGLIRQTPAWSIFQTQKIIELLERESFGDDEVTDLFFTNYKSTDLAGHYWNMVDPEVREDLEEQDRQLRVLVDALDDMVGRDEYVVVVTADHGMARYPKDVGGWSIDVPEINRDLEQEFPSDIDGEALVLANRGYQIMLRPSELEQRGISPDDVAQFLGDYTLEDNVTDATTELFESTFSERAGERLFLVATTPEGLDDMLACARKEGNQ